MSWTSSGFEVVPRSQWPPRASVTSCANCGKAFGLFRSGEHCNACGKVFCTSGCLDNDMVLPGQPGSAPVPVCDTCAMAIHRMHEDSEQAVHRCHILEDLLNEQTLQSERMQIESRALKEENEKLTQENSRLQSVVKQLELEKEVLAAQASLAAGAASPAVSPTTTGGGIALPTSSGSPASQGLNEPGSSGDHQALEKRKKQLDAREATLQTALKKVSADAAKLVSQRNALQEQEKQLKAVLTKEWSTAFEGQRSGYERLFLEERSALGEAVSSWLAEAEKRDLEGAASGGSSREAAAEAALQALREEKEKEMADLIRQHAEEVALVREAAKDVERRQEEELHALRAAAESVLVAPPVTELNELKEQLLTERKRWEDDKLILQSTIQALKRAQGEFQQEPTDMITEHERTVTTLQARVKELEADSQRQGEQRASEKAEQQAALTQAQAELLRAREQAAALQQANQDLAQQYEEHVRRLQEQLASRPHSDTPQAAGAPAPTASAPSAAGEHERVLAELVREHEGKVEALQRGFAAEKKRLEDTITELRTAHSRSSSMEGTMRELRDADLHVACHAEKEAALQELREAQAEELYALQQLLQTIQTESVAKLRRLQGLLDTAKAEKSAMEKAAEETTAEAAAEQKRAIDSALRDAREAWEREEAARVAEAEKAQTAEKDAALARQQDAQRADQAVRDALEEKITRGEEARGLLEQQLAETQAALQRSRSDVGGIASHVLSMAKADHTSLLQLHEHGLARCAAHLSALQRAAASVAADSKGEAESRQLLQRQLNAAKREAKSHETKVSEQSVELLQVKRQLTALTTELAQTKEKLKKTQRTLASNEKAAAAVRASFCAISAPSVASSSSVVAPPAPLSALPEHTLTWTACRLGLMTDYVERVICETAERGLLGLIESSAAAMQAELERRREVSRRNAIALENTTSTIRTLQEDLRQRATELQVRESSVAQRDTRLYEREERLQHRKQRMLSICKSLALVAKKVREKELASQKLVANADGMDGAGVVGSAALFAMAADRTGTAFSEDSVDEIQRDLSLTAERLNTSSS